ncbi:hypothetical protein [Nocardia sp. NPDC052112]|uniref:hypothetical protein n=1 Tax=Nocardia sp. NPDC052112 TaxID=3155646 RepID=UPI0034277DC2
MRFDVKTSVRVLAVVCLVALAGCSNDYNDKRGRGDAPVKDGQGDNTPAEVFNMPDGFGNVATKCVGHGYRAYVTTNATGPSNINIVADDTCKTKP